MATDKYAEEKLAKLAESRALKALADEKQETILNSMLSEMVLERNEMTKVAAEVTEDLEDLETQFSKWNEMSQKEFATSPIAMSKMLNKVEVDNTKTLESLKKVMDNFSELLVSNQHEFELDESEDSVLAEEKAAQMSVDIIRSEFKSRRDGVGDKMKGIFTKSKKEFDNLLASMASVGDGEESVVSQDDFAVNIIPMLQKKNQYLQSQLDLANLKSKSVSNQWIVDRAKLDALFIQSQKTELSLKGLLRLSESRLRFREQSDRDQNFLPSVISQEEYDILKALFEEFKREAAKEKTAISVELSEAMKTIDRVNAELNLVRHQVDSKAGANRKTKSLNPNYGKEMQHGGGGSGGGNDDRDNDLMEKFGGTQEEFEDKMKSLEQEKNSEIQFCTAKINDLTAEIKVKDSKIEKLSSDLKNVQSIGVGSSSSQLNDDSGQSKTVVDSMMKAELQKLKMDYDLMKKERDDLSKAFEKLSGGIGKIMDQIEKTDLKVERRLEVPYESINKLRARVSGLALGLGLKPPTFKDSIPAKVLIKEEEDFVSKPSSRAGDRKAGSNPSSNPMGSHSMFSSSSSSSSSSNSTTELLINQYEEKIRVIEVNRDDDMNYLNSKLANADTNIGILKGWISDKDSEIDLLTKELTKVSPSNAVVAGVNNRRNSVIATPLLIDDVKRTTMTATAATASSSLLSAKASHTGRPKSGIQNSPLSFWIDDADIDELSNTALTAFQRQSGINDKLIACSSGLKDAFPEFISKLTEVVNSNADETDINNDLIYELSYLMERGFHALGVSLSDFILQGGVINKASIEITRADLAREMANQEVLNSTSAPTAAGRKSTMFVSRTSRSHIRTASNDATSSGGASSSPSMMEGRMGGSRGSSRGSAGRVGGGAADLVSDEDSFSLANSESQRDKASRTNYNNNNNNPAGGYSPVASRVQSRGRNSNVSSRPGSQQYSSRGQSNSDILDDDSSGDADGGDGTEYTGDDSVNIMRVGISERGGIGGAVKQGLLASITDAKVSLLKAHDDDSGNGDYSNANFILSEGHNDNQTPHSIQGAPQAREKIIATYYDDERSIMQRPQDESNIEIKYEDIVPRPRSPNFYTVQQEIVSGELMFIGDIRNKNFEALMNKGFGPDKLIKITLIEHHIRYQGTKEGEGDGGSGGGASALDRMQARAMVVEAELLISEIAVITPLEELARYKRNTERHILQLQTFTTWKKIQKIRQDGIFLDILTVHRDIIEKCIAAAGGWKGAMKSVKQAKNLFADTSVWPEFFRVQVLEFYRHSLFEDYKTFEKKIQDHQGELDKMKDENDAKVAECKAQIENLEAEIIRLKEKKSNLKRVGLAVVDSIAGEKKEGEGRGAGGDVDKSDDNTMDIIDVLHAVQEQNLSNAKIAAEETKMKEQIASEEVKSIAGKALMSSFNTSDIFLDDVNGQKVLSLEEKIKVALEMANKTIDSDALVPDSLKHIMSHQGDSSSSDKFLYLLQEPIDKLPESHIIRRLHLLFDRVILRYFEGDVSCAYILEMANDGLSSWTEGFDNDTLEIFSVCFKSFKDDPNISVICDLLLLLNNLTTIPEYMSDIALKISNAIAHYSSKDRPPSPESSSSNLDRLLSPFAIERRQREEFKERINDNFKEMNLNFQQQVATSVASALLTTVVEQVDIGIQTDNIVIDDGPVFDGAVTAESSTGGAINNVNMPPPVVVLEPPKLEELQERTQPGSPSKDSADTKGEDLFNQLSTEGYNPRSLPPGFSLAHVADNEVELCPGVTLVSPEKWPQDCVIPPDVIYVYKKKDAALLKGLKRLPRYVRVPRVEGFEAVSSPSQIELFEGASIIFGSKLPYFATLPPGVVVMKLKVGCRVPTGLTTVQMSPILRMPPDFTVPPELELVQMHTSMLLPGGIQLCQGIQTADNPTSYSLPFGLQFIKRTEKVDLPGYMTALEQASFQEEEISVHGQMNEGCTILKKPHGFQFGLGIEILHRPAGHTLPAGMSPAPLCEYPKGLKLSGLLELVQLTPRFDIPSGCIINKDWQIISRPASVRLQPNCYLMKFNSNQRADTKTLPNFIIPVPLPALPKGGSFPKNVICGRILPGVGFPLPDGFQIAPGITVLPLSSIKYSNGSPANVRLPINAILVKREPNTALPPGYERGSCGDLPAGALLDKNMEVILIATCRFEVPAGVKLGFGLVLGRNTQLCPDCILSRDLKVIEWPSGMIIHPGVELVELAPRCDLPYDYEQVNVTPFNPFNTPLPPKAIMVKLPEFIKVSSTQQLAEKIEIIDLNGDMKNKPQKAVSLFKKLTKDGPLVTAEQFVSNVPLPEGLVFLHRQNRFQLCPSEITLIPKTSLPLELAKTLEMKNGNTIQTSTGTNKDKDSKEEKRVVEVCSIEPTYHLPPGVELAKGVFVLPAPTWLLLPSWVELVGMNDPYQFDGTNSSSLADYKFEEWRAQPFISQCEVLLATSLPLPPNSVIINVEKKSSLYSWQSAAPGVESVEERGDIWLPVGHYLIERPRPTKLPSGFELGFSSLFPGAKSWYKLDPGMEIIHLLPSYHLPLGITLESSLVLKQLLVMQDTERFPPPMELYPSLCKLWAIVQFSPGQTLSNGCTVLPFPHSYLEYGNPIFNRLINTMSANPISTRVFDNKGLLVFVSIDPTVRDYMFPPQGCFEFPDAQALVSQHFPFLKLTTNITAIVLPERILNHRDRLMQNANAARTRTNSSGDDSSAVAAKKSIGADNDELIIHPRVKEKRQVVEAEAEISTMVPKKASSLTELTTREDLISMINSAQVELELIEEENTQYRHKYNEITRENNHVKNKLDRLVESQLTNDEQFRHYREEISGLKGEISRLEKGQQLKSEELQKLSRKYMDMQERMSAQIGVLQDQVATWKDASASALEEKRVFKQTLANQERALVEGFDAILKGTKVRFRLLMSDVLDQVCYFSTAIVCALKDNNTTTTTTTTTSSSSSNGGLQNDLLDEGLPSSTPSSDQLRLPTIPSSNTLLSKNVDKPDDDALKMDHKVLLDRFSVVSPKPAQRLEDANLEGSAREGVGDGGGGGDGDDVSVLSDDSLLHQDGTSGGVMPMSIQSIGSGSATKKLSGKFKSAHNPLPAKPGKAKTPGTATSNKALLSSSSTEEHPELSAENINPSSYEQMIRSDDRYVAFIHSIDIVLESFRYVKVEEGADPTSDFKEASFCKKSLTTWFHALVDRAKAIIGQERNKFRILSSRNDNEIKAFLKQCRSLNRNIDMLEKMLLEARGADIRAVPESNDNLLKKVKNLESSIDIMRESTLNPLQGEFNARVETIKSYKETEESLFFEILILKKKLMTQEAIVQSQLEETRAENRMAPQEIKAIKHNIKVQKTKLDDLTLRRQVVKKSMEDLMTVIIDDIQSYERLIQKVMPANIIESILKWGTNRGLIVDHKEDLSDVLSLKLFAKGSGPSYAIDTSDEVSVGSLSSLGLGSLQSGFNIATNRPGSNESSTSLFPNIANHMNDSASLSSLSQSSSLKSFGGRSASKSLHLPARTKDSAGDDILFMPQMMQNGSVGTLPAASALSHLVSNSLRKGKMKSSKKK